MSDQSPNQVKIIISNKEYQVACPEGQEPKLAAAADFLNQRIQEMKDSSAGIGTEQTAVITALNLAHDLLEKRHEQSSHRQNEDAAVRGRLQTIKNRLDANTFQRRMGDEQPSNQF